MLLLWRILAACFHVKGVPVAEKLVASVEQLHRLNLAWAFSLTRLQVGRRGVRGEYFAQFVLEIRNGPLELRTHFLLTGLKVS